MSNGFYNSVAAKNTVKNANESPFKNPSGGGSVGWIGENMIALGSSNK